MTVLFQELNEWIEFRRKLNKTIGFVPTMGCLHEGHLSLIKKSIRENEKTAVSVYVNPIQFNDQDDFKKYPRMLSEDLRKIEDTGADWVIAPKTEEILPINESYEFLISERGVSNNLEGKHRPGHFDGVLKIVLKFINIVRPENIYMGEKDYQQFLLIKNMVNELFLNTKIIACETVREPDGLAMSSRNLLLDPKDREIAPLIYKNLSSDKTTEEITNSLKDSGFDVEYVSEKWGRLLAAVKIGNVRLIDNVPKL